MSFSREKNLKLQMLIGNIISNVLYGAQFGADDRERFLYISGLITEQVCP